MTRERQPLKMLASRRKSKGECEGKRKVRGESGDKGKTAAKNAGVKAKVERGMRRKEKSERRIG